MDDAGVKSFLTDLQEQLRLYQRMLSLNEAQHAILLEGVEPDPDDLMRMVADKQDLMRQVVEHEARIKPLKADWQEGRTKLPERVQAFASKLLDELAQTVERLIAMEDETHRVLESRMATTAAGMSDLQRKAKANRAYSAYGSKERAPKYLDRSTDSEP